MCILVFLIGQLWFIYDLVQISIDLVVIANCLVWVVFAINGAYLMFLIWHKGALIVSLLHTLNDHFPRRRDAQEAVQLLQFVKGWNRIMGCFETLYIIAIVATIVTEPIWTMIDYYAGGEFRIRFPVFIRYPFDTDQLHLIPVVFAWEILGTVTSSQVIAGVSALLGAMLMNINLQFKMLANELNRLQPRKCSDEADTKKLIQLSVRHERLLAIAAEIRNLFSFSLLLNYVLSSVMICMLCFVIANASDAASIIKAYTIITCFIVYNAIYSHYGNQIMVNV